MKKSIFVASLLIAGVAIADSTDITCDNVLGVLPVNVPSNRLEVILSVPWVQPGGGDTIAVSNFVKTAGLDAGVDPATLSSTTLSWYSLDDGDFRSWYLNDEHEWRRTDSTETPDPTKACVKQGEAIILAFTNATTAASTIVYLVGQVGTNGTITTTIPGAQDSTPTYTLVAPPCGRTTAIDMNDLVFEAGFNTIDAGDEITTDIVNGLPARYVRKNNRWVFSYNNASSTMIPAGRGFWYKRCGATDLHIKWDAPSL